MPSPIDECEPESIEGANAIAHTDPPDSDSELARLVDVATLQRMQDRLAALCKTSLVLCRNDGTLITNPSWGGPFVRMLATSDLGRVAFANLIRTLARDPAGSVASICFEDVTLHATPITHNERRLAIMIIGTRPRTKLEPDTIRALADEFAVDQAALTEAADSVEPWTPDMRKATYAYAESFAETIAALYGQAEKIQRQVADLRVVCELAAALTGTGDLQAILDQTAVRIVEAMSVKACGIRLLDEESGELVISAVHNLSPEYLGKGPVILADNEIDRRAFAGETIAIEDVPNDPRIRYPDNARREGIVSGLCVPMTHRGKTIGVVRVYTAERHTFSDDEKSLLRAIATQAAAALINQRLTEERAATQRFQQQLRQAAEIQRCMLPTDPPTHPTLAFGAAYSATLELGGDAYDFIEFPDASIGVFVADVVGKGLPAALMMASVRSALLSHATFTADVSEVIARVNRHMCRETLVGEFATMFYGVFSSGGRRLSYCSAGHEPTLLLRDGVFSELSAGGLVLGIDPAAKYDYGVQELRQGDIVVLTTDGVAEAMNFQGEPYGRQRLRESILRHRALDASQHAGQILWDVRRFVGLADQSDDITVVAVTAC